MAAPTGLPHARLYQDRCGLAPSDLDSKASFKKILPAWLQHGLQIRMERTQMFEIFKEFTFEAAHHLAVNVTDGHRYSRLHGHSFQVQVFLKGEPDEKKNWLCDFGEIEQCVADVRSQLDHTYLNEIAGLEVPTLENISRWIWNRLDNQLLGLDRIVLRRGSCGEGCVFHGRPN